MHSTAGQIRARQRGFTIVECLLAGVILAVFSAAIATAVGQARAAARRGEDVRLAADRLDEVMTKIDMVGPARLLQDGPMRGDLDERFSWSATIEDELLGDLYTVTVTIRWQTGGKIQSVTGYTQFQDTPDSKHAAGSWYDL